MKKIMIKIASLSLLMILALSVLPMSNAEEDNAVNENISVPVLEKGQKWSQSISVDLNDMIGDLDIDKIIDEAGAELKDSGILTSFDVDVDFNGGGIGLYMTSEVMDDNADVNGEKCYQVRNTLYFGSGLGIEASANIAGSGISIKGSGSAEYYVEFDLVIDMWMTTDELAITRIDATLKPSLNAEAAASVKANIENMNFDIKGGASIKTENIVASATLDFDEPFDILELPIEENEKWTPEGDFTGTASVSGKIRARADITGIPEEDDIHEDETIDLAQESGGEEDFEDDMWLALKSGKKTTITLADGSTTPVIPISPDFEAWEDDFFYDDDDYYGGDVEIMAFEVRDGVNVDESQGCFFTIRAMKAVDIDPSNYFFYVTETGRSPKALDFAFRDYEDQGEDDLSPVGGDRNKSYRYDDKNWKIEGMNVEATGSSWSDSEYIGFDMPMANMGITIEKGAVYEVMIKNPDMEIVYQGSFVYQQQGGSRSDDDDDEYYYEEDYYYEDDDDGSGDDYYYEEDYSDPFEEIFESLMGPEGMEINLYYAPELGMIVQTELVTPEISSEFFEEFGITPPTISQDGNFKSTVASENEVDSFKDERDSLYSDINDKKSNPDDKTNMKWIFIGLGILVAVAVLVLVVVLMVKGKKPKEPSTNYDAPTNEDDPYRRPPPPVDSRGQSRQEIPPPPAY
ncbi:MAG: hypothetical protein QGH39_03845 [Candidatus Thermoplasmatota archaeon]|nr:hypothetical protein [Candidatus Thermoplasmatota archaeon]